MQLGFVIDHGRCIGCHACTVACKAENDVPLGSFRTWVKYTEEGSFPEVKRSFAVLRCNQCTDAPCIEICPVKALDKRPDGIVDVDPAACIGCKACMQGCPYDALYINDASGTAEKCHFCAHRTERGLAPACAVVCPTEAIIPGDFHDSESLVWKLRAENGVTARKTEAGTGPNVFYKEVAETAIDPSQARGGDGYLWAERLPGLQLDAQQFQAAHDASAARARTTYNVDHPAPWGFKVSAYLFTKSLAAGLFLVLGLLASPAGGTALAARGAGGLSLGALLFLGITSVLLVADLKRPERFLKILLRPNWSSWLARGSVILIGYTIFLVAWTTAILAGVWADVGAPIVLPLLAGALLAVLTAGYTASLFRQSKGRVLWMRRGLWPHLVVQAILAGAALTLVCHRLLQLADPHLAALRWCLVAALGLHALFVLTESRMAPPGREREYGQVVSLITDGPFAVRHYALGIVVGILMPLLLLAIATNPGIWAVSAGMALVGLWVEEDILVRAGQALPIS